MMSAFQSIKTFKEFLSEMIQNSSISTLLLMADGMECLHVNCEILLLSLVEWAIEFILF